jgi:hypothetical protein
MGNGQAVVMMVRHGRELGTEAVGPKTVKCDVEMDTETPMMLCMAM